MILKTFSQVFILIVLLTGCSVNHVSKVNQIRHASQKGKTQKLNTLIGTLEVPNERDRWGYTSLMYACRFDQLEAVRLLLDKGADPNLKSFTNGNSAIYYAMSSEVTSLLFEGGADLNIKNVCGDNVMHWSICKENGYKIVEKLLQVGIDPNGKNNFGHTPLHIAVGNNKTDLVKNLIDKGAEVNIENMQGLTPRDIACVLGNQEIIEILDQKGGVSKKYFSRDNSESQIKRDYTCQIYLFNWAPFKKNPGFYYYGFSVGWTGGSFGRVIIYLSGYFFIEPGHTYEVSVKIGSSPMDSYATVVDIVTRKRVGYFSMGGT